MKASHVVLLVVFALILGVPLAMRPKDAGTVRFPEHQTLIIVTPHVPQIQSEFSQGFLRWHQAKYGSPAFIDWRTPGGTTEISALLTASYSAAAKGGAFDFSDAANPACKPGTVSYDMMFGGGSYEFGKLKKGIKVAVPGADGKPVERTIPLAAPVDFSQSQLDAWYGENKVGTQQLYDPQKYWFGAALSSFGIVFNRDELAKAGMASVSSFDDLADPRLFGKVALADPRQSGSVATSLDAILSAKGWDAGWRLLREISANARYFTNSSPKPPIDVSFGEAAAGFAIDFYGRGQAQAVAKPGEDPAKSRVGYVDPKGAVYVDADPIAMLRGAPHPELARHFIEFCLSEEGQALWQFHATDTPQGASNPRGEDGALMGPAHYELRRMPVRRETYDKYAKYMVDQLDPFGSASQAKPAGWRGALGIMMGAFGVDTGHDLREAWAALIRARQAGSSKVPEMERLFYAFPETTTADGHTLAFTPENFAKISDVWKDPKRRSECEIQYTRFFADTYRKVIEMGR
ncbi:MAG: extracellular solute-binding protein [Tepidisphaera sp.]|nr:extracellular solute-binding protein [Tepidisphaera sp.]